MEQLLWFRGTYRRLGLRFLGSGIRNFAVGVDAPKSLRHHHHHHRGLDDHPGPRLLYVYAVNGINGFIDSRSRGACLRLVLIRIYGDLWQACG